MLRTAAVAVMAMAVIGCGDAATDRLPPESRAVMVDPAGSPASIYVSGGAGEGSGPHALAIPSGTRVQVLDDDDTHPSSFENRMVEVRIVEGEHREAVGFVARSRPRPGLPT